MDLDFDVHRFMLFNYAWHNMVDQQCCIAPKQVAHMFIVGAKQLRTLHHTLYVTSTHAYISHPYKYAYEQLLQESGMQT
jgi:hypothetical protein